MQFAQIADLQVLLCCFRKGQNQKFIRRTKVLDRNKPTEYINFIFVHISREATPRFKNAFVCHIDLDPSGILSVKAPNIVQ
jgi:hypothetical protein